MALIRHLTERLPLDIQARLPSKLRWKVGLSEEIDFWRRWLATKGLTWPDEYAARLDAQRPLQPHVRQHLCDGPSIDIIDVGAGPLTVLGKKWGTRTVNITAVDALADIYDQLLAEAKVVPLVRTRKCDAERLSEVFPENSFDLAYSQNALDHSYAPDAAIEQMLLVVKTGSYVLLRHAPNEAENEGYSGLHQWNFDIQDGRFVIYNKKRKIEVATSFAARAQVLAWRSEDMIYASLKKCA